VRTILNQSSKPRNSWKQSGNITVRNKEKAEQGELVRSIDGSRKKTKNTDRTRERERM
jgi:hypothetical protein